MNKRQKKKQERKLDIFGAYYVSSYRELKVALRVYHEYDIEQKRRFGNYERCKLCEKVWNCEQCVYMTKSEIENCKEFRG